MYNTSEDTYLQNNCLPQQLELIPRARELLRYRTDCVADGNFRRLFGSLPDTTSSKTMEQEERIAAASKFIPQSPPGEINDVLNDLSKTG